MNATHTPGPWRWWPCKDGSYDQKNDYIQVAAGDKHVAQIRIESVSETDMRLIAAAPELLAVLHELQESAAYWSEYDVPLGITERINAAIAKATGEQQ